MFYHFSHGIGQFNFTANIHRVEFTNNTKWNFFISIKHNLNLNLFPRLTKIVKNKY